MKSGTAIGLGLGVIALIGGAAMYYLQSYAYYQRQDGLEAIEIGGRRFAVSDYHGLVNDALPLRLRGCFRLADPEAALAAAPPAQNPEPFAAPGWFECWSAAAMDGDLKAGRAGAVVAAVEGEGDFAMERIVVVYPDGRGYQWRRLIKGER